MAPPAHHVKKRLKKWAGSGSQKVGSLFVLKMHVDECGTFFDVGASLTWYRYMHVRLCTHVWVAGWGRLRNDCHAHEWDRSSLTNVTIVTSRALSPQRQREGRGSETTASMGALLWVRPWAGGGTGSWPQEYSESGISWRIWEDVTSPVWESREMNIT